MTAKAPSNLHLRYIYRPHDSKVRCLVSGRDTLPDSRQISAIELTYAFSKTKAGEITIDFSMLSSLLYESEYESQLWMLYNCHKELLRCGDAYVTQVRSSSCSTGGWRNFLKFHNI